MNALFHKSNVMSGYRLTDCLIGKIYKNIKLLTIINPINKTYIKYKNEMKD